MINYTYSVALVNNCSQLGVCQLLAKKMYSAYIIIFIISI